MKKQLHAFLITLSLSLLLVAPAVAQTPRPTPTNVAPQSTDTRGSIFGSVYADVDGDGNCIGTGVAGEEPLSGVTIQFTSSDGATVIPLTSGADGSYGLVAAGESNWEVLVLPNNGTSVSSTNPRYVPVYRDEVLDHTGINFCVRQGAAANAVIVNADGTTSGGNATVILAPEAGAPAQTGQPTLFVLLGLFGFGLVVWGSFAEYRRRAV